MKKSYTSAKKRRFINDVREYFLKKSTKNEGRGVPNVDYSNDAVNKIKENNCL